MAPPSRPLNANRLGIWAVFCFVLLVLSSYTFLSHTHQATSSLLKRDVVEYIVDIVGSGSFRPIGAVGTNSSRPGFAHKAVNGPVSLSSNKLYHGPAHQNPAKAPPRPVGQLAALRGSGALDTTSNNTNTSLALRSRDADENGVHLFGKRDALRCDDGPCIDGSCCSAQGICGFGPSYCGSGCRSQCNATAMCGQYSENAELPCGMNLCCSAMGWCGHTSEFCNNADPAHLSLPCQAGFGSCKMVGEPSCSADGGSSSGRTIGYYQSWNVRERLCNKVSPKQLDTTGYTHLFYAFASIDPTTFKITPAEPDEDPDMMREFTSLKKPGGLQTWIAVGGFDFSNDDRDTHTTWSDLCADQGRRAAFIASVKDYMSTYGFQGVDLDWEYPGDPDRGGRKLEDTRNFVLLVKELRAALGTSYGISVTLAPDYWYLRWFDAKAIESSVDFFGFMAYDLHGFWDSDVEALGSKVRGQTDIREIANDTIPLWYDALDPAKINFGVAMYGRGYTLSDPKSCNGLLCPFSGPSKAAPCTNFDGVMSLYEIKQLIASKGITPQYLPDAMMKQITWDDQWIGYDDEETIAAKKRWASSRCFGGTMAWSIDFQVTGSGDDPETDDDDSDVYGQVVSIGPEVYQTPTAQCPAPCVMVFPPETVKTAVTLTIPPYTATLQVGSTTTTVVAIPSARTTTVTVISYYDEYVPSSQQTGAITLFPSFSVSPVTVTVTGQDGKPTPRVVTPPPVGRPPQTPVTVTTKGPDGKPTTTVITADGTLIFPTPETVWPFFPPWTSTTNNVESTVSSPPVWPPKFSSWPPVPPTDTTTTTAPVGIWPPWGTIKPVDSQNDPPPTGGSRVTCKVWFFFICISWGEIRLDAWDITLPPGTWGGGPPPPNFFQLPPGWHFGCPGCIPPWPKISVGPGGEIDLPKEPDGKESTCEPTTATLTIESTSYGTTTTMGTVRTTATQTLSKEFPCVGCSVKDRMTATTVTGCSKPTSGALLKIRNKERERQTGSSPGSPGECGPQYYDLVLFPKDTNNYFQLQSLIIKLSDATRSDYPGGPRLKEVQVIAAPSAGFMGFIVVTAIEQAWFDAEIDGKYDLREEIEGTISQQRPGTAVARRDGRSETNGTQPAMKPLKRATSDSSTWAAPFVGVPPRKNVNGAGFSDRSRRTWKYQRDASECNGQFIYLVDDAMSSIKTNALVETIKTQEYFGATLRGVVFPHGDMVASMAVGVETGICRNGGVTLVTVEAAYYEVDNDFRVSDYHFVESFVLVLEHIASRNRGKKSVMNISTRIEGDMPELFRVLRKLACLKKLDSLGVVIVAASGNDVQNSDIYTRPPCPNSDEDVPSIWVENNEVPNIIMVGATDQGSRAALFSSFGPVVTVHAPGSGVEADAGDGLLRVKSGTSFAAPIVAGLVAYYRALPNFAFGDLSNPARVKRLVEKMQRIVEIRADAQFPYPYMDIATHNKYGYLQKTVWNGMLDDHTNCLVTPHAPGCPTIDLDGSGTLDDECANTAITKRDNGTDGDNGPNRRQVAACPIGPANGGGGGGGGGPTRTLTYRSGTPSPTCTAGCGKLCTGFWCRPSPTDNPPFFTDPANAHNSGMPTLSGSATPPPIPTNCAATTTWQSCNGGDGGHGEACKTLSSCVATKTSSTISVTGFLTTTKTPSTNSVTGFLITTKIPGGQTKVPRAQTEVPRAQATCRPDSSCGFKPGMMAYCDEAAQWFNLQPDTRFGTGNGNPSWRCHAGPDGKGGRMGCVVILRDVTGETGQECQWKGKDVGVWWNVMRNQCDACADMGFNPLVCQATFKFWPDCAKDPLGS